MRVGVPPPAPCSLSQMGRPPVYTRLLTRFDSVREYHFEGDDSAGEEAALIKPYRVGSTPRSPTNLDAEPKAD